MKRETRVEHKKAPVRRPGADPHLPLVFDGTGGKRDAIEMVTRVVYWTEDGWETVNKTERGKSERVFDKDEADFVRYLAMYKSTSAGGRS